MDYINCGYKIETSNSNGQIKIYTRKANSYYLPNKETTIDPDQTVTVVRKYENGLQVTSKKKGKTGKFRVTRIATRELTQPLYDEESTIRKASKGIVLSEETIKVFSKLPDNLKAVCESSIEYIIESARKAIKR